MSGGAETEYDVIFLGYVDAATVPGDKVGGFLRSIGGMGPFTADFAAKGVNISERFSIVVVYLELCYIIFIFRPGAFPQKRGNGSPFM